MILIFILNMLIPFNSFSMEKEDDGNGNNHSDYPVYCGSEKDVLLPKINHVADSSTAITASPAIVPPSTISITTISDNNGEELNGNNLPTIEKKADNLETIRRQNTPQDRRWIGNVLLIATLVGLNIAACFSTHALTKYYNQRSVNNFIKDICCPFFSNQTLCSNATWDTSQCFEYDLTCAGIDENK